MSMETTTDAVPDLLQKGISGIIYPPPDIRILADKTAEFIAANGEQFESKMLEKDEQSRVKFCFLLADNPYNAYYKLKVSQIREGVSGDINEEETFEQKTEDKISETVTETAPTSVASSISTVERNIKYNPITYLLKSIPTTPPPDEHFLLPFSTMPAIDMEIIKLTAQFTAVNGRKFLDGITTYQSRNPQFDFLKPTHLLNGFFTSLVESYAKILHPERETKANLIEFSENKENILKFCLWKQDYQQKEERRRQEEEALSNNERLVDQTVNWNQFTVVETITFNEKDFAPAATSNKTEQVEDMDVDMEMDEDLPAKTSMPPPPPPPPSSTPAGKKIVTEYTPKLKTNTGPTITGFYDEKQKREISVDELSDHMRIGLMDPKWREQKERYMERQAQTNLVDGTEMSKVLSTLKRVPNDTNDNNNDTNYNSKKLLTEDIDVEDADMKLIEAQMEYNRKKALGLNKIQKPVVQKQQDDTPFAMPTPDGMAPRPLLPMNTNTTNNNISPKAPLSPPNPSMSSISSSFARPMMPSSPPPTTTNTNISIPIPSPSPIPPLPRTILPTPSMPSIPVNIPPPQPITMSRNTAFASMTLLPEQQFLAIHPGPVTLFIILPVDNSTPSWKMNGQTISFTVDLHLLIKDFKEQISKEIGNCPTNKFQLKHDIHGFLKDKQSLASYNLAQGTTLMLLQRQRGGKK
ncbi:hypothetical protein WA158_006376 [Blastocystis sp. Blastoise]